MTSWQPLKQFRDRSVPKLNNLRRAADAGLRVPPTWWAAGASIREGMTPPAELGPGPWILRSGSPTEDTRETSNAGQLLSLPVHAPADFGPALRRVVEALPTDAGGRRLGFVFVQPLLQAEEAGVVFFDGFYYERTSAQGSNEGLTSGQQRGDVKRGHLARQEPWSDWLRSVYAAFGKDDPRLDAEFARDADGYILLQVRPALFPVARNPTLSLANHKEIMGDPPSPWLVSALIEAGRDLSFLANADRTIATWDEAYAIEAGERAWLNLSFWYRWMDHFGLPRTMVTEGVGGEAALGDERSIFARFITSIPRLCWFQWCCLRMLPTFEREYQRLDEVIARAHTLPALHQATVEGLKLALRGNFAINAVLSGVSRIRRTLRLPGSARVVTQDMMDEYRQLASAPPQEREAALDRWLEHYGHRGPLESDLARPRFRELRDTLLHDLMTTTAPPSDTAPRSGSGWLVRLLFRVDERREWFRDQMMRRWETLRTRILAEANRLVAAGELATVEDAFYLRPTELTGALPLKEAARQARQRVEAVRYVDLPTSASRDEIQAVLARAATTQAVTDGRAIFAGISLHDAVVEGRALKADDLVTLLQQEVRDKVLGPDAILVVPTLEPSWAVIFPRVGGVVAELGGELSHASILLREARRPAIVNCAGIFRRVATGDRLRLDGARGFVEVLSG